MGQNSLPTHQPADTKAVEFATNLTVTSLCSGKPTRSILPCCVESLAAKPRELLIQSGEPEGGWDDSKGLPCTGKQRTGRLLPTKSQLPCWV